MIAVAFYLVVLPIVAVLALTVLDILSRKDIGVSKLFWLPAVLFVPLAGFLLDLLFRPKEFEGRLWTEEPESYMPPVRRLEPVPQAAVESISPPPAPQERELDRAA